MKGLHSTIAAKMKIVQSSNLKIINQIVRTDSSRTEYRTSTTRACAVDQPQSTDDFLFTT